MEIKIKPEYCGAIIVALKIGPMLVDDRDAERDCNEALSAIAPQLREQGYPDVDTVTLKMTKHQVKVVLTAVDALNAELKKATV